MINSIDERISFSHRHPDETIRNIIRYDSGYLKNLFLKDERIVFSPKCLSEIQRLTKKHKDNWEKTSEKTSVIFDQFKTYASPYLFDFNNEKIVSINNSRLNK